MKTVEQMLEELHADKAVVYVMLNQRDYVYVSVEQSEDYNNKFEFKINERGTIYEIVKKAYDRYIKLTDAAPELVPHRLPPPKPVPESEYTEYTDVPAQKDEVPF